VAFELDAIVRRVSPPDEAARDAASERQTRLTKPTGALGRLEELSVWASGVRGRCPPEPFRRIDVVLLAADHGIAQHGVSAYPPEVTAQMVANFVNGGAAVNVLAGEVDARVHVVDVGVSVDVAGADGRWKVRRGSGAIDREDALTAGELERALAAGVSLVDERVDAGADLLVPGDMGIGSTTACAAVVAALLSRAPTDVCGRGTGVDDAGLARKVEAVRAAIARLGDAGDACEVVRTVGGADLAVMTTLLIAAAARRTPVVLDGVVSCTAALLAARLAPQAVGWWVAAHRSTEPAQQLALEALGLRPVLDLDLRLGEGTGALLAVPLLQSAVATLRGMATFADAGVTDRPD
jgi:nicotinate-nucleotide--dimethylbenzimidazole phosphoribosyltransferase